MTDLKNLHNPFRTTGVRTFIGAGAYFVHRVRKLGSFLVPFLAYHISGRISPVLAGYKITHKCNLRCEHCPYWRRSGPEQDFEGVILTLRRLSDLGVRILILEGGEPLLWRSGNRDLRDVVKAARRLFSSVCITTNGTLGWAKLDADRVWVSLDGPGDIHDAVRGEPIFDKVIRNLEREGRGRAFVSTTINTRNVGSIPDLIVMLKGLAAGITIQFHYPYNGLPDDLFVPPGKRASVLDELIRLKSRGYPVANSFNSLKELKQTPWTCEDRLLANVEPDGTILHGCYLKNRGPAVCSLCGFSAHNEMSLAFKGQWQSIAVGMKTFF
ncbi:MAG: radical SAM protein [Desulfomonilaceae bacterium]|nr:radical SAM protein [Desulfomonilaceae bacterium]